ncbi:MAG: ABC transporter permease [Thermoprotei archaeon]|nr:MAG: ABC transporter permease [Thermoprotei archaeon]
MSTRPLTPKEILKEILRTKSGLIGVIILVLMVVLSIFAVIYTPYDIVNAWNDPVFWQSNPRLAAPEWINIIAGINLPKTIILGHNNFYKSEYYVQIAGLKYVNLRGTFKFQYDYFPSELSLFLKVNYSNKSPLVKVTFVRPDGNMVTLYEGIVESHNSVIYISTDPKIRKRIRTFLEKFTKGEEAYMIYPEIILFAKPDRDMWDADKARVLKGTYELRIEMVGYNPTDTLEAKLIVYGRVYGLVGTDDLRRDLLVGIAWGAPITLAFGLIAAVLISVIQVLLGIISAWFGGIIDEAIQRLSDILLVLPFLPIVILISFIYGVDIWRLLLIVVVLSIVGSTTKVARSIALQVKSEQYVEAAISYGASGWRIIFLYIFPRLLPYTIANIVMVTPSMIFLEAALALIGLIDPRNPTWGRIIADAYDGGAAVHGYWWWILIPASLIILVASAFAMIGYSLDKIVNPRLRER